MAIKISVAFVVLLVAFHGACGSHFRGGSMSWKPMAGNKIELTYNVGFKFDHTEARFDPCTVEAAENKQVLHTSGKLQCESCNPEQMVRKVDYICTEYDIEQDWSIGKYVMEYDIPAGQSAFSISYESCCWMKVVSPDTKSGSRAWNMETEVNVTPRPDGKINSSPVAAPIPLAKYQMGCTYNLRIAVSDPDNDILKCKYYESDECAKEGMRRACGQPTRGLTLNKDCSLVFNTEQAGAGSHAVNVMIRDCPNARCKKPYSKIPLLFLINVEGAPGPCMKPSIIIPPSCNTILPNQPFEMTIKAEAGDESKPVSRITSQKPSGMEASPMEAVEGSTTQQSIKLTWTPTSDQMGKHTVCFSALDSDGFTSGRYCTFILVSDQPPLIAEPTKSTPAKGAEHGLDDKWVIKFIQEVQRPTQAAFIRIVDESDTVMAEINAMNKGVVFSGKTMEFTVPKDNFPFSAVPVPYRLQLDEGVALHAQGGCMSEAAEWEVLLKDNANMAILPMEHCTSSTYGSVDPATCDMLMTEMLPGDSGEPVPTGYKLCCTCIGGSGPPGGQAAGPPGRPVAAGPPGRPGRR